MYPYSPTALSSLFNSLIWKKVIIPREFFLLFSKNYLIYHYTHLGFKKRFTHQNFKKALLGEYKGISIINPVVILANLKICSKFLFQILMSKTQRICFIVYNMPLRIYNKKFFNFGSHFFFRDFWPCGLLSNELVNLFSKKIWKKKNYYPGPASAYLTIGVESKKLFYIVNEAYTYGVPMFNFVDSTTNLSTMSYWIPTNLRSNFSKFFWLTFFKSLLNKSNSHKKSIFRKIAKRQYRRVFYLVNIRKINPMPSVLINPFRKSKEDLKPKLTKKQRKIEEVRNLKRFLPDFMLDEKSLKEREEQRLKESRIAKLKKRGLLRKKNQKKKKPFNLYAWTPPWLLPRKKKVKKPKIPKTPRSSSTKKLKR